MRPPNWRTYVASYAFVIPELDRQRLLPTLIGIHSVEARHAAWLATLLETNPFPEAIDRALTLEQSEADSAEPTVATRGWHTGHPPETALTAAIAEDLGVTPQTVQVVTIEPRDWPDSSLGCPQPDMLYAQVVTPGYGLVEVSGERIEYHTDERGTVVRCPDRQIANPGVRGAGTPRDRARTRSPPPVGSPRRCREAPSPSGPFAGSDRARNRPGSHPLQS